MKYFILVILIFLVKFSFAQQKPIKVKIIAIDTICNYYVVKGNSRKGKLNILLEKQNNSNDSIYNVLKELEGLGVGKSYKLLINSTSTVKECNGTTTLINFKGAHVFDV